MNVIVDYFRLNIPRLSREFFEDKLTSQEARIAIIVSGAIACLGVLFLTCRYYFKASVSKDPSNLGGVTTPDSTRDKNLSPVKFRISPSVIESPSVLIKTDKVEDKEKAVEEFYQSISSLTYHLKLDKIEAWQSPSLDRADLRILAAEKAEEILKAIKPPFSSNSNKILYCSSLSLEANHLIDYLKSPYRYDFEASAILKRYKELLRIVYQDAVVEAVCKGWIQQDDILDVKGMESLPRLTVLKISQLLYGKDFKVLGESQFLQCLQQDTKMYPPLTQAEQNILIQGDNLNPAHAGLNAGLDYDDKKRVGQRVEYPRNDRDFCFSLMNLSGIKNYGSGKKPSGLKMIKIEWIEDVKKSFFI